jgi:Glucose-6-phosphate dehydrogenase, NAD binding domain
MTSEVQPRGGMAAGSDADGGQQVADVFVVFGITGDLAKVMTFHSLYRLERRGLLSCPIVGVAVSDWSVEDLRNRARESIEGCGEQIDETVFARLAARLSYVSGDFGDSATYTRVADAIGQARTPVFYLEIPPFLFGRVIKGLTDAGLTKTGRVVVEKPFGHDLESARALAAEIPSTSTSHSSTGSTTSWERWVWGRSFIFGSRTRSSSRSGAVTTSRRCRSRWPRASGLRTGGTSTIRLGRSGTWSSTT